MRAGYLTLFCGPDQAVRLIIFVSFKLKMTIVQRIFNFLLKRDQKGNSPTLPESLVVGFYRSIIKNPIGARDDPLLRFQFESLTAKQSFQPLLSDQDKILIKKLYPDFQTVLSETAHLFLLTLEAQKLLFKPLPILY